MTVVAEGVETQEQEDFLREHGCDQMQGFYFSKPVHADEFVGLWRLHAASTSARTGPVGAAQSGPCSSSAAINVIAIWSRCQRRSANGPQLEHKPRADQGKRTFCGDFHYSVLVHGYARRWAQALDLPIASVLNPRGVFRFPLERYAGQILPSCGIDVRSNNCASSSWETGLLKR